MDAGDHAAHSARADGGRPFGIRNRSAEKYGRRRAGRLIAPAAKSPDLTGSRDDIEQLRQLLAQGATFDQARAELRRPRSTLHWLAVRHKLYHRRRSIPDDKERAIARLLARGETERTICRLLQVGKGTVYRRKETRRKRLGTPKTVPPYRCQGPCGQVVRYAPCQICPALLARQKPGPNGG